ncbi:MULTISPECIES: hypothetical protein [unclassified Streptomyces]|uniref:hypothetical protein n=1 Tax=unclassified Streptomyces TaxID=2593676 RepID=UPI00380D85AE
MIEDLPWAEYASDPDKYVKMLEQEEEATQKDLFKVRQRLRHVRHLKKQKDTFEDWKRNGVPDQRKADDLHSPDYGDPDEESGSSGSRGPTRKQLVKELLVQDPSRIWKVAQVVAALQDGNEKALRVAMDDMWRAGILHKHPGALYQYNVDHG